MDDVALIASMMKSCHLFIAGLLMQCSEVMKIELDCSMHPF
jgi:hypothetical protein